MTTTHATADDGTVHTVSMPQSTAIVLELMRSHPLDGVCSDTFQEHRAGRFGARIYDLRKLGFVIERSMCTTHLHPNRVYAYHVRGYQP